MSALRRFWRWLLGRGALSPDPEVKTPQGLSEEPQPEEAAADVQAVLAGVLAAGPSSRNRTDAVARVDDDQADELPVAPLPALLFAGGDRSSLFANAVYLTAPVELQQVLVLLDAQTAGGWFTRAHGLFELERERRAAAVAPVQRARTIAHLREALRERHLAPSGWDAGPAGLPAGNGYGDVAAVRPPRRRRPRRGGAWDQLPGGDGR